ncbi:TlpA family protein disulfide reductase [Nesterenkonia sandarakina]|uniref:Peroxiredoxin n=1 Tax=Nesterenkonia sandarakina TaxID=272918 RepID=A0A2T0YBI3_9MICC|nr:TlpA disulfide reductase family protein [Nesterenkonia sandarakina]PRZ12088.1 peroxiredoxin [Nesterenkonia sandarakina]
MTADSSPTPRTRRHALTTIALTATAFMVSACGSENDDLAQRAQNDGSNYISGDGSVEEYAPDSRGAAVAFEATLFNGTKITPETLQGEVTVLNFWYAACAPCRVEAPDLEAAYEEFRPDGVQFFGINTRDTQATAEAFERNFGITYPSMEDRTGEVMMAMTDYVHPSAVPTTLVLDTQARVSARVVGIIEPSTLRTLISTVLNEDQADLTGSGVVDSVGEEQRGNR